MNNFFTIKNCGWRQGYISTAKLLNSKISCFKYRKIIALYSFALFFVGGRDSVYASQVRDDVPYQTFRDFAENKGLFYAGAKDIFIKDKKGKVIERLDKAPMPDFSSVDRVEGVATLISPQYAVSVKHNAAYHFDNLYFAEGHYKMVNKHDSPATDFSLIRLNKVVSDVVPAEILPDGVKNDEFDNKRFTPFYRIGSGIQRIIKPDGKMRTVAPAYQYLTGGIVAPPTSQSDSLGVKYDNIFLPQYSPLTSYVLYGDSGSPLLSWDNVLNKWMLVAITKGGNTLSSNSFAIIPVDYVRAKQETYDAKVIFNKKGEVPLLWHFNSATGTGTIFQGGERYIFRGKKGSDLNNGTNLSFKGSGEKIILQDHVHQGAGTLKFEGNYTVMPASNQTWAGGGIDIARGAQVIWGVPGVQGDDLHKIGEGGLIVNGTGINPGGLKVGNGVVLLAQRPDSQNRVQAFSSLNIASGRPTVVLNDERQLDPDTISWGRRGGILDVKGNSLGFRKINAADYGAILDNTAEKRAEIKFNLDVAPRDTPLREWSHTATGTPGELYHYQNSNTSTSDYFILKKVKYSFFPVNQTSDASWEFIGHNREQAVRTVYERNKSSGYIYHGQIKGNINIFNEVNFSAPDALILDGSIAITGDFKQDYGKLIFQGHPVIHAYNDKDFVSQLGDNSVRVQPVSFIQPDWERRSFRLAELQLKNTQFSLSRNATLTGNINAINSAVILGAPIVYIDLNDGNGIINFPQKGSSVAGLFGDMSQYQGKVTIRNRSLLDIRERFNGTITAQDSRVTVSSRNAQLNGYSQFINTPLVVEANAKLTAKGGWSSDSDISVGPSSTLLLSAKNKKVKNFTASFYTLNKGAQYLLQAGSTLRISPFVFFTGDIFSANSSNLYFGNTDTTKLAVKLSPQEQQKVDRFGGFKNVWKGNITAPRSQVNLTNTRWMMQKDARVKTLTLSQALAGFTGESTTFSILSTGTLRAENSGFLLWTDLKSSDKVVIHSQATGRDNTLFVEVEKGKEKVTNQRNLNIPLVTAPADTHPQMFKGVKQVAGFSVVSPVIHVQQDASNTKWILDGFTSVPNPQSSKSANNFLNMAYKSFIAEVNHLHKRMGDLRDTQSEGGMWARTLNGTGRGEQGYSERYTHFQSGFDKKHRQQHANIFTGMLASYTNSHFSSRGYRGNTLSFGAGLYASAIFDSGAYIDVIGKYIHHQNTYLAAFAGLTQRKYNTRSWYGGAEVGYRYSFTRDLFVEPQAELTYGAVHGITQKWQDNGEEIAMQQKPFNPLIGRAGMAVGKIFDNKYGAITVRAGLDYQFDLIANGGTVLRDASTEQRFANKKDSRLLYHVGLNGQAGDNLRFGVEVERSAFGKYNINHAINANLRYSF